MPQLVLEYSSNIYEKDLTELLKTINVFLSENLPTQLSGCKSRAVAHNIYCVGNGMENQAFVHIRLQVLAGRTPEKLNEVGNHLMNMLKDFFIISLQKLTLEITIEISELARTYLKYHH